MSTSGEAVKEINYNVSNTGSTLFTMPTANMPKGAYVMIVNGNNEQFSKPVIIANK